MIKKQTELVFILDKSGSMGGLEKDTVGGYNAMLKKQQLEEGEAVVTTVLFNDQVQLLHDAVPLEKVEELTAQDYQVGGMTALHDAIGHSIQQVARRQIIGEVENKVLVVITTDGMENSSKEFTAEKIKKMIAHQQEYAQWEFIFLGANIDAVTEAEKFGIDQQFAVNYHAYEAGLQTNFDAIHEVAASFRQGKGIDDTWKDRIEADYKARQ